MSSLSRVLPTRYDLFDTHWIIIQLLRVMEFDLEQVVVGGRRLADDGDVVLRKACSTLTPVRGPAG